jgi:hypothetical protein
LPVPDQDRQRQAIQSLPSVEDVAFGGPAPVSGAGRGLRTISDPEDPSREINFVAGAIDSRFIDMLGLRMLHGRAPTDNEVGVAVINQTAAREYFGRENVVGESLPIAEQRSGSSEIVGVLADLSLGHPSAKVEPLALYTATEGGRGTLIRSSLPVAGLQQEMQGLIDSGALEVDTVELVRLGDLRNAIIAPDRARGLLTIGTSCLVVLLAGIGFYGTQRYLVAAGRREYAIRASLGAGPAALGRLVFRRSLSLSLPGFVIGGLLSFIVVAWMREDFLSPDVSPGVVSAAVVTGLAALVLLATLGPAREARRTQPATLLRED